MRSTLLVLAAISIGMLAWSGEARLLPAAMLFPALWSLAPSRFVAALVAAGYFLAASRGLPQSVVNFFGSGMGAGCMLWIAASIPFVATHALLWTPRSGSGRTISYAVIAVLLSVPPLGIVGWAHPITLAGILFPGWSWLGLGAAAVGLLAMTTRFRAIPILVFAGFWIWSAANWTAPNLPRGWVGLSTQFGGNNGQYADYEQHHETIVRVRQEAMAGAQVIVLPEGALGVWTPTVERLWVDALESLGVTVIGGAIIFDNTGYWNVMLELSQEGSVVHYRQRMPVPVSMWQPWLRLSGTQEGARADFFARPVNRVGDLPIATLICYEQLLIWPVLQSAFGSPTLLIAPANGWWATGTDILPIQIAATTAWARLFDLPLVLAVNI